jgi:hypothetical protein
MQCWKSRQDRQGYCGAGNHRCRILFQELVGPRRYRANGFCGRGVVPGLCAVRYFHMPERGLSGLGCNFGKAEMSVIVIRVLRRLFGEPDHEEVQIRKMYHTGPHNGNEQTAFPEDGGPWGGRRGALRPGASRRSGGVQKRTGKPDLPGPEPVQGRQQRVEEKQHYLAVPPKVALKNTIRTGDSAVAGFVYGLTNKEGLQEALTYAVAAGTNTALREGTALCAPKDFLDLLPRTTVRKSLWKMDYRAKVKIGANSHVL